jgi:hypothetical protein
MLQKDWENVAGKSACAESGQFSPKFLLALSLTPSRHLSPFGRFMQPHKERARAPQLIPPWGDRPYKKKEIIFTRLSITWSSIRFTYGKSITSHIQTIFSWMISPRDNNFQLGSGESDLPFNYTFPSLRRWTFKKVSPSYCFERN